MRVLLESPRQSLEQLSETLATAGITASERQLLSVVDTLTLAQHAEADIKQYGGGIASTQDGQVVLDAEVVAAYRSGGAFATAVDDLLETAAALVASRYELDRPFTPGRQYSRKESTRLLTLPRKWTSTLYGYKVDRASKTCPIFVTLHKSEEVTASTAYEDTILDRHTMLWYTRSRRTLASDEVKAIVDNDVDLHVFVKKDDAEGSDFYYLGQATSSDAEQTTMHSDSGQDLDVVRMLLRFEEPIDSALFDYFHPEITQS